MTTTITQNRIKNTMSRNLHRADYSKHVLETFVETAHITDAIAKLSKSALESAGFLKLASRSIHDELKTTIGHAIAPIYAIRYDEIELTPSYWLAQRPTLDVTSEELIANVYVNSALLRYHSLTNIYQNILKDIEAFDKNRQYSVVELGEQLRRMRNFTLNIQDPQMACEKAKAFNIAVESMKKLIDVESILIDMKSLKK